MCGAKWKKCLDDGDLPSRVMTKMKDPIFKLDLGYGSALGERVGMSRINDGTHH